jgi:hypothetical protein
MLVLIVLVLTVLPTIVEAQSCTAYGASGTCQDFFACNRVSGQTAYRSSACKIVLLFLL